MDDLAKPDLPVEEIVARVQQLGPSPPKPGAAVRTPTGSPPQGKYVVLTGGEPMLFAELIPLTAALKRGAWHVTIETAGTLFLPVECDLMSLSPKLSNSTPPPPQDPRWEKRHERHRHAPGVVHRLLSEYAYQLKFVIDRLADIIDVQNYLDRFDNIPADHVWLMPQARTAEELREKTDWLETAAQQHGFQFTSRLQIELFGNARGT